MQPSRRAKAAIAPPYQLENPDMHDTLCRVAMVVYHHIKRGEQQAWQRYRCRGAWDPGRSPKVEQGLDDLSPELEESIRLLAKVASGGPQAGSALLKLQQHQMGARQTQSPREAVRSGEHRNGAMILSPQTQASTASDGRSLVHSGRYSQGSRAMTAEDSGFRGTAMPDLQLDGAPGSRGGSGTGLAAKPAVSSAGRGASDSGYVPQAPSLGGQLSGAAVPISGMRAPRPAGHTAVWSARAGGLQPQIGSTGSGSHQQEVPVGSLQQSSWHGPALLQAARRAVEPQQQQGKGHVDGAAGSQTGAGSGAGLLSVMREPVVPQNGTSSLAHSQQAAARPMDTGGGLALPSSSAAAGASRLAPASIPSRGVPAQGKKKKPRPVTRAGRQGRAGLQPGGNGNAVTQRRRSRLAPSRPPAPLPAREQSVLDESKEDPLERARSSGAHALPDGENKQAIAAGASDAPSHLATSTPANSILAPLGPDTELDVSLQSAGEGTAESNSGAPGGAASSAALSGVKRDVAAGVAALSPGTGGRSGAQPGTYDLESGNGGLAQDQNHGVQPNRSIDASIHLTGIDTTGGLDSTGGFGGGSELSEGSGLLDDTVASGSGSASDGWPLSSPDAAANGRSPRATASPGLSWWQRVARQVFCCGCCSRRGADTDSEGGSSSPRRNKGRRRLKNKRGKRRRKSGKSKRQDGFQSDSTDDSWVQGKYGGGSSAWSVAGDSHAGADTGGREHGGGAAGSAGEPGSINGSGARGGPQGGDGRGGIVVGSVAGTPFLLARSHSLLRSRPRGRKGAASAARRSRQPSTTSSAGIGAADGGLVQQETPSTAALQRWWGPDDPWEGLPAETHAFHERNYLVPCYRYVMAPSPGVLLGGAGAHAVQRVRRRWSVPTPGEIFAFAARLCLLAQLTPECPIVCLVYLERVLQSSGGRVLLLSCTWRPLVAGCLLLASKVWQDLSTWNAEVAGILGLYPLPEMNLLERRLVAALRFRLFVAPRSYAQAYFGLRSLGERARFRKDKFRQFLAAALPDGYGHGVGAKGPAAGPVGGSKGAAMSRQQGDGLEEKGSRSKGTGAAGGAAGGDAGGKGAGMPRGAVDRSVSFATSVYGWGDSSVLTAPTIAGPKARGKALERAAAAAAAASGGEMASGSGGGGGRHGTGGADGGSVAGGSVRDQVLLGYEGKGLRGRAYRSGAWDGAASLDGGGNDEEEEEEEEMVRTQDSRHGELTGGESDLMGAWGAPGNATASEWDEDGDRDRSGAGAGHGHHATRGGAGVGTAARSRMGVPIAITRGSNRVAESSGQDMMQAVEAEGEYGSAQLRGLGVSRGMESFNFSYGPLAQRESGRASTPDVSQQDVSGLSTTAPARPPVLLRRAQSAAGTAGMHGLASASGQGQAGPFGSLPRK